MLAKEWNYHWVWWVGDFAGAIIAVIIVKFVYVPGKEGKDEFSQAKSKIQFTKRALTSQVYSGGKFTRNISTKNKPILLSLVFKNS